MEISTEGKYGFFATLIGIGWISYVIYNNHKNSKDIAAIKSRQDKLDANISMTNKSQSQPIGMSFSGFAGQPDSMKSYGPAEGSIQDFDTRQPITYPKLVVKKVFGRDVIETMCG